MSGMTRMIFILAVNILCIDTGFAAPAAFDPELEMKSSWQDNAITPVVPDPCLPNGCWEWLPVFPVNKASEEILREESNAKIQTERQMNDETNTRTAWKSDSRAIVPRPKSSTSTVRQISPKPVKKDVFMSRSWGPGGLPFSVLYLNHHATRSNNRQNTGMPEFAPTKPTSEPTARQNRESATSTASPTKHPNYRLALRNGSTGQQPRRKYSIIPQLFISYGWGPLGK